MRILIEEYSYDLNKCPVLRETLHGLGLDWNTTRTGKVSLSYVGYFYNPKINDCVFILPKVLLKEGAKTNENSEDGGQDDTVFGMRPEDIILIDKLDTTKIKKEERDFIYEFAVWIYRAIVVYNKDNKNNIIQPENISQISHTRRRRTNTMLDVILSLIQFGKDHQDFITFTLRNIHSGYNKINWTRTINRSQAIIQDGCPIYLNPVNKKRQVNFDEELLVIFYSILNYVKEKYGFKVTINVNFPLIKGAQFKSYINGRGVIRLRQIKYKYFSDIALELWELCNAFFDRSQNIYSACELKEFLLAKNFYIVFEAIIDELVGSNQEKHDLDKKLYDQQDGKIVDHLYTYQGLMEAGDNDVPTYYIGDSKYYKIGSDLGEHSIFKQNTYARNIIQYNIDLWDEWDHSESKDEKKKPLKLRDKLTEGYNILPNFFISASMKENDYSYTHDQIERKEGGAKISYQFRDRLFDRDTLLLSHYNVNFLFVIALYARNNSSEKEGWIKKVREEFRREIQRVLKANYVFYVLRPKDEQQIEAWIQVHFKEIQGKIFRPYDNESLYIFALEKESAKEALRKREPIEELRVDSCAVPTKDGKTLLEQLESAFVIKPVDEHNSTLDNAIEQAAAVAQEEAVHIRLAAEEAPGEDMLPRYYLERYKDAEILIGLCKGDKYWAWIKKEQRYNVRLVKSGESICKPRREGVFEESELKDRQPKFVIIYDAHTAAYRVFLSAKGKPCTKMDMEKSGYPKAKSENYYLFPLIDEVNIGEYQLDALLNAHWPFMKKDVYSPIFVTGEELLEYKK